MIKVELDDMEFNTGVADADGLLWYITNYEGWEMPALRQSFLLLTGYDGVALGESAFDGRTLILEGVVKSNSGTEASFWLAYNKLLQKLNKRFSEATFKLHEGATVKTLGVVLSDKPQFRHVGVGSFSFQFSLMAQYPIKLSDTEVSTVYNGAVAVTNDGSYQTWPVIVMDTAGTPSFTNTSVGSAGATIAFTGELPVGTTIDFRKKTVENVAGDDLYHLLDMTNDDWWPLMPAINNLTRGGTGNATIYHRHAWL